MLIYVLGVKYVSHLEPVLVGGVRVQRKFWRRIPAYQQFLVGEEVACYGKVGAAAVQAACLVHQGFKHVKIVSLDRRLKIDYTLAMADAVMAEYNNIRNRYLTVQNHEERLAA